MLKMQTSVSVSLTFFFFPKISTWPPFAAKNNYLRYRTHFSLEFEFNVGKQSSSSRVVKRDGKNVEKLYVT